MQVSMSERNSNHVAVTMPSVAISSTSNRFSFKVSDEFFHGMISYRVRTEGQLENGGNNLARLIWSACSDLASASKEASHMRHFHDSLENCGKWPREFGGQISPIRVFLDQVNLRPGVPWKGTGKTEDGGFLGAVSRSLLMIPLFSAAPVRFRLQLVEENSSRFKSILPLNVDLKANGELYFATIDAITGSETAKKYSYKDVRDDGSFYIETSEHGIPDVDTYFWLTANFLPSNGSGPRGSLADMLTIMQPAEQLQFHVVNGSEAHVVMDVVDINDHIFFANETLLLTLLGRVKVVEVVVQGSKAGRLNSKIKIDAGKEQNELIKHSSSSVVGCTEEIDRCDNVLMELMLTRALRALSADGFLHPCKLIMPVFVDDMGLLFRLADRLPSKVSQKTADSVRVALEGILKRKLNSAELDKWINVSVKAVVMFFFDFQGVQLYDSSNCFLNMKEKAVLVRNHIVSTVGIEAQNNSLVQYMSNNPLAQELHSFLDTHGLAHIRSTLVKHELTSVKEFSLLSEFFSKNIASETHAISKKPLLKEAVQIFRAVQDARTSKFSLPISERLKSFEDTGASVLTILYSTYAIYLALSKPLFAAWLTFAVGVVVLAVGILQVFQGMSQLPYYTANFVRSVWMFAAFFAVNVFKSVPAGHRAHTIGAMLTAVASAVAIYLDKLREGKFDWSYSSDCATLFSDFAAIGYKRCVTTRYVYFGYLALLYFIIAICVYLKQELVFRWVMVGVSLQLFMTTAFDYMTDSVTFIDIGGCILWPVLLMIAEVMKHYGSLKAMRFVKADKLINDRKWRDVCKGHNSHLKKISDQLETFGHDHILDRSSKLGKWSIGQKTAPPSVHQPTSDFDELYDIAIAVNDKFQSWIESFFQSEQSGQHQRYLWFDASTPSASHHHAELFSGRVIRGPVKTPERAIAKVIIKFICL